MAALPTLSRLEAPNYFAHDIHLDGTGHPVVRILHPSSRRQPPFETLARWNGSAWDALPQTMFLRPMPVVGARGQLYVRDFVFGRSFQVWDSGSWRTLPPIPFLPEFSVRDATTDRATGNLVAALSDGARIFLVEFRDGEWVQRGPALSVQKASCGSGTRLGLVSIAADEDSLHLAYVQSPSGAGDSTDIVVAALAPDGWTTSSPASCGALYDPQILVGAQGQVLIAWTEGASPVWKLALSDAGSWQELPPPAAGFALLPAATIRDDDGAPVALFARGFDPSHVRMNLIAATWKNGGWETSPEVSTAVWGSAAVSTRGDAVTSEENGGSISFTVLEAPR